MLGLQPTHLHLVFFILSPVFLQIWECDYVDWCHSL